MSLITFFRISPRSHTLVHSPLERGPGAMPRALRVVSFNIKSARYLGRRERDIAALLRAHQADVVALQEVLHADGNQTERIATEAGFAHWAFGATIRKGRSEYGVALLSRLPIERVSRVELLHWSAYEPRLALHAVVALGDRQLHVLNAHADVFPRSALANAQIIGHEVARLRGQPTIVMGDLNQEPSSEAVAALSAQELVDLLAEPQPPILTFPSSRPRRRIDYILASPDLAACAPVAEPIPADISDHLAVTASFDLTRYRLL